MARSESHKRAQSKAAGKHGKTEVPLPGNRRLDAESKRTATEVERSGDASRLAAAARRLKASGKAQKVLQVPHKDMGKAVDAMKSTKTNGTVKNMGGTKRRSVQK